MTRIKGPGWDVWTLDQIDDYLDGTDYGDVVCKARRSAVRFPLPGWWRWRAWHRAGHPTELLPTPDYR